MALALARFETDTAPKARRLPDERDRALLTHLRMAALECRAAPRADLFEACAVLAVNRVRSQEAHATVLMRTLPQMLGRRARMLRPGAEEISFDETWLLAAAHAIRDGDHDSLAFLTRSRIPPYARRNFAHLMRMVSERFHQD